MAHQSVSTHGNRYGPIPRSWRRSSPEIRLGSLVKKKTKTLKQIGEDLNLSKERIRQIELVALQKLRQSLSPEQFDLLTG